MQIIIIIHTVLKTINNTSISVNLFNDILTEFNILYQEYEYIFKTISIQ